MRKRRIAFARPGAWPDWPCQLARAHDVLGKPNVQPNLPWGQAPGGGRLRSFSGPGGHVLTEGSLVQRILARRPAARCAVYPQRGGVPSGTSGAPRPPRGADIPAADPHRSFSGQCARWRTGGALAVLLFHSSSTKHRDRAQMQDAGRDAPQLARLSTFFRTGSAELLPARPRGLAHVVGAGPPTDGSEQRS